MKYINNFIRYRYLLSYLVFRDITVKYKRSILGIAWSILNPLLMMSVIVTVFQGFFKMNIDNYPVYFLTGSLIYNFFSEATTSSLTAILGNASLVKKVYIPKYIFVLEKCLFAFVNALFYFVALIIVMIVLKTPIKPPLFLSFIPLTYCLVFSIGFGMIITTLNTFFRDTGHLYSVFIMAMMYLTPIIYPIDAIPKEIADMLKFNPLFYYVQYFRDLILYNKVPDLQLNLICISISLSFLIVGMIVFKKYQDKFILYM
ncbi:ABC transporter permease [Clostridium sp. OS1-26]|uniref:ABC transporter permease n=1 Tax=Clostridium sp. OS1-26 TaxID=3070681 RepID=UPI0027E0A93F|nr:ABC transporter permease [Clostridium sp. OS1-26]WML36753.1 ABC transporter permease [Clostridium sp. OS1-26]